MRRVPIHIALSGLRATPGPWAGSVRDQFRWARSLGVRGVRLDAADTAIRPRDLGRSGRRDLAAALRREELVFGGLDLLIPPAHFEDPQSRSRAVDAVVAACALAGELSSLGPGGASTLGVTLPEEPSAELSAALASAGERWGVRLADFTPRDVPGAIGIGVDTAASLAAGRDPVADIASAGGALVGLRLADWAGGSRCVVGADTGRLDALAVAVAVSMTDLDAVDLDLRGLADPALGVRAGLDAWQGAQAFPA